MMTLKEKLEQVKAAGRIMDDSQVKESMNEATREQVHLARREMLIEKLEPK